MATIHHFPTRSDTPRPAVLLEVVRNDRSVPTVHDVIHREMTLRHLAAITSGFMSSGLIVSEAQLMVQSSDIEAIDDRLMREALVGSVRATMGLIDILSTNKDRALRAAVKAWLVDNGEAEA